MSTCFTDNEITWHKTFNNNLQKDSNVGTLENANILNVHHLHSTLPEAYASWMTSALK